MKRLPNFFTLLKYLFFIVVLWFIAFVLSIMLVKLELYERIIATSTFLGALGLAYTAIQTVIAVETYRYNSMPLVLHRGFCEIFDKEKAAIIFENIGERPCYNIRGWCTKDGKAFPFIFGQLVKSETEGKLNLRGDEKYVWLGKGHQVSAMLFNTTCRGLTNCRNHLLLLYEDHQGNAYFSLLLEKDFTYLSGLFDEKKILNTINVSKEELRLLMK